MTRLNDRTRQAERCPRSYNNIQLKNCHHLESLHSCKITSSVSVTYNMNFFYQRKAYFFIYKRARAHTHTNTNILVFSMKVLLDLVNSVVWFLSGCWKSNSCFLCQGYWKQDREENIFFVRYIFKTDNNRFFCSLSIVIIIF